MNYKQLLLHELELYANKHGLGIEELHLFETDFIGVAKLVEDNIISFDNAVILLKRIERCELVSDDAKGDHKAMAAECGFI